MAFVLWQALQKWNVIQKSIRPLSDSYGIFLGCFAGFTSFISHAGGPAAAILSLSKKPTKTEYQATTVIVFWAVNLAKAVPYTFLGLFTFETLFSGSYFIALCSNRCLDRCKSTLYDFREIIFCFYIYFTHINWD